MEKRTLKELRVKFNLTQAELSKKIGVSPVTLCHWETGRFQIPQMAKMAIGNALNIDWHVIEDVPCQKSKK